MFGFFKKKLKTVIDTFSSEAEEQLSAVEKTEEKVEEETKEAPKEEKAEKGIPKAEEKKDVKKEAPKEEAKEKKKEEKVEVKQEAKEVKEEKKAKEDVKEEKEVKKPKVKDSYEETETVIEEIDELKREADEELFDEKLSEIKTDLKTKAAEIKSEETAKKPGFFQKITKTFMRRDDKKGVMTRITGLVTTTKLTDEKFEEFFEEMEIVLLENNVALEVVRRIKDDLKKNLVDKPLRRGKVAQTIKASLKNTIYDVLDTGTIDLLQKADSKKPYVILFVGINGSGKTTTIAKITKLLQDNNLTPVISASDTFRAAAIQQLEEHANKLGVKLIKHDYGSDPAAVAFDTIKYAKAKNLDVVLIDTAGRLQTNVNLMDEMKKVVRVAKPDLKIFVGESITGNDCVEQARQFNEAIGVDAIILSKADVDEKGGAAISTSYVTRKPIIFLGTGQEYKDLTPFNPDLIVESLGLTA